MKKESIWRNTVSMPCFDKLRGDLETDVLIIGGGIAGLLCAYFLQAEGVDYLLLEADKICGGTTGNTTAKITSQHGLIYHKLIQNFGREGAELYLRANEEALEQYRKMSREINCDFREQDAFLYCRGELEGLLREWEAVKSLGFPAELSRELPLPFPVKAALKFPQQAQFHPLKFLSQIAKDLKILENSRVIRMEGDRAVTPGGSVRAKRVIVATHFPFINRHGGYFIKLYQDRSYALALKNAGKLRGMYLDADPEGLSFRGWEDLLILGGGSHRTGQKGGGWEVLSQAKSQYYPGAEEVFRWAAQDCMSLDGLPYIGAYSKGTKGLYTATGFHKWGMTLSMTAAMVLRDLVLERENPYARLFDPSRSPWRSQLFSNLFHSATGLLTLRVPRCPHMGCALSYNRQEHSWDCPCHGSRFAETGELLEAPAVRGMKRPR